MSTGGTPVPFRPATDAQIRERVRAFLVRTFYIPEADSLADDTSLLETGIVDSTGVLEIVAFLQSEFGVQIKDSELTPGNLDCIASQVRFVAQKLAAMSA